MTIHYNDGREFTPDELVARWRGTIKESTLAVWRSQKKNLPYNKRGSRVTYSLCDIIAYEEANKINPS